MIDVVVNGFALGGDMERYFQVAYYGAFFFGGVVICVLIAILVVLMSKR